MKIGTLPIWYQKSPKNEEKQTNNGPNWKTVKESGENPGYLFQKVRYHDDELIPVAIEEVQLGSVSGL